MWTQGQLARFGHAVEALGKLEERLEMANERLPGTIREPDGSCR